MSHGKVKEQKTSQCSFTMAKRQRKRRRYSIRWFAERLNISSTGMWRYLRHLGFEKDYRYWIRRLGLTQYDGHTYSMIATYIALARRHIAFYTLPPLSGYVVPWPWIIVNVFNVSVLEKYIDAYKQVSARIAGVILDAAVDKVWKKPIDKLQIDYDDDYWNRFWNAVDYLKSLSHEAWFSYEVVVPDYVDDYSRTWGRRHALWIDDYTNIDRTLENIAYVVDSDRSIPWLVPAQGYEDIPESMYYSILALEELGLTKRYRIALANLCTSRAATIIAETVRKAREACRSCSFHIFGPSLSGIKKLLQEGLLLPNDSWDSTAWTFPRGPHLWSCKNSEERLMYFLFYLKHIYEVLS